MSSSMFVGLPPATRSSMMGGDGGSGGGASISPGPGSGAATPMSGRGGPASTPSSGTSTPAPPTSPAVALISLLGRTAGDTRFGGLDSREDDEERDYRQTLLATAEHEDYFSKKGDFHPLAVASSCVLAALRNDESDVDSDLHSRITSVNSGGGSSSIGPSPSADAHLYRYHNSTNSTVAAATPTRRLLLESLEHEKSIPFPAFLANQALGSSARSKVGTLMGLLPEAHLAWLAVDCNLFLWSFAEAVSSATANLPPPRGMPIPEDFCQFQVPSGQCIISVALVKPKKGVFREAVHWCIVIATADEVMICGLAREKTSSATTAPDGFALDRRRQTLWRLLPTKYVIPTDNVPIMSVQGTSDGRIFLGGFDGSLYEMSYGDERLPPPKKGPPKDDGEGGDAVIDTIEEYSYLTQAFHETTEALSKAVISSGKRALSSVLHSSDDAGSGHLRSRKCRRINHSTATPKIVSAVVPGLLQQVFASFDGSPTAMGGPILSMTLDAERNPKKPLLYALTAKGYIHAFDVSKPSTSQQATVNLRMSVDVAMAARKYLQAVAHGRMYPESYTVHGYYATAANLVFAGGTVSAQAGVGGTTSARSLLKMVQAAERSSKTSGDGGGRHKSVGLLHPVSIHVLSKAESSSIHLVAVAVCGLRYYFTEDYTPARRVTAMYGPSPPRFTLCHIRAPPQLIVSPGGALVDIDPSAVADFGTGSMGQELAILPGRHSMSAPRGATNSLTVSKAFYGRGLTLLAMDSSLGGVKLSGNIISSTTPDYTLRSPGSTSSSFGHVSVLAEKGLSEVLGFPMMSVDTGGAGDGAAGGVSPTMSAVLPNGPLQDIASITENDQDEGASMELTMLTFHSKTPTKMELDMGFVPAYFPPSKIRKPPAPPGGSSNGTALAKPATTSVLALVAKIVEKAIVKTTTPSKPKEAKPVYLMELSAKTSKPRPPPQYRLSDKFASATGGFVGIGCAAPAPAVRPASARTARPSSTTGGGSSTSGGGGGGSTGGSGAGSDKLLSTRSARLSPWLVTPKSVPLCHIATQHLGLSAFPQKVVSLNAGGLHLFTFWSIRTKLAAALMRSKDVVVSRDETVRSFFISYGFGPGCAMCLSLAVHEDNDILRKRALQAALSYAHVPKMLKSVGSARSGAGGFAVHSPLRGDVMSLGEITGRFPGYAFHPSFICDGVVVLLSRLLRPFWYKPAVVVTEGKTMEIKTTRARKRRTTPATVDFLLDNKTAQLVRRPLATLQKIMQEVFPPAVSIVPGVKKQDKDDKMDVDKTESDVIKGLGERELISLTMRNRALVAAAPKDPPTGPSKKELDDLARTSEERLLHSLYRLLSRTIQLLDLLLHLRQAHATPELPEVDWGLLHGLTHCQLATTQEGQERMETLLTSLISVQEETTTLEPSFEITNKTPADRLASVLSSHCFLFFSYGSHLGYLGFRTAAAAKATPLGTPRRSTLSDRAASYLRSAALSWHSPSIVTGRVIHADDGSLRSEDGAKDGASIEFYKDCAMRAITYGSPVARAALALLEVENMAGLVDVCLICASNFGGKWTRGSGADAGFAPMSDGRGDGSLPWERGLYHRQVGDASDKGSKDGKAGTSDDIFMSPSKSDGVISGLEVTRDDARRACHAILFAHLLDLLTTMKQDLARDLLAVACSSTDTEFLHSLYDFLRNSGHVDTLLRIDSPTVESWIQKQKKDDVLLWRYFIVQGKESMAGEALYKRGTSKEKIPLEDRIDSLTRALTAYRSALDRRERQDNEERQAFAPGFGRAPASQQSGKTSLPSGDELKQKLSTISDLLDLANLQRRTQLQLLEIENEVESDKLETLRFSLLNASDLYNDYAFFFALFDVCLLTLRTCKFNETDTITMLWKSIMCEELVPCTTRSASARSFLLSLKRNTSFEDESIMLIDSYATEASYALFEDGVWIPRLKERVLALGKELLGKGADYTFPFDVIVKNLDGLNYVHKKAILSRGASYAASLALSGSAQAPSWSLAVLLEVGVAFPVLLDVYNSMLEAFDRSDVGGNPDESERVRYFSGICEVLIHWIRAAAVSSQARLLATIAQQSGVHLSNTLVTSFSGDALPDVAAKHLSQELESTLILRVRSYITPLETVVGLRGSNVAEFSHLLNVFREIHDLLKNLAKALPQQKDDFSSPAQMLYLTY